MSEIINAVREVIKISKQESLQINDILKAISKNRTSSVGAIERDELITVINHYKNLSVIYVDENENILFL